jgi:hypothetical protein
VQPRDYVTIVKGCFLSLAEQIKAFVPEIQPSSSSTILPWRNAVPSAGGGLNLTDPALLIAVLEGGRAFAEQLLLMGGEEDPGSSLAQLSPDVIMVSGGDAFFFFFFLE